MTIIYPFVFLSRRIIFSILILCMFNLPFAASLLLLVTCLAITAMVITEQPWDSRKMNVNHVVNEVALYLCKLAVFFCCKFEGTPE